MTIKIACPNCGEQQIFRDEAAGKRVQCPNCKHMITMEAKSSRDPVGMPPQTAQRVIVVGVELTIFEMIVLGSKWSIASVVVAIPWALALWLLYTALGGLGKG